MSDDSNTYAHSAGFRPPAEVMTAGYDAAQEDELALRRRAEDDARAARAELVALNDSLEDRVAERTARLVAANEEMQRFADMARHDLKAPVRALMTIPEWLRETVIELHGKVDPRIESDLAEMERQARRLDRLIADLIAFGKIGLAGEPEVFDPAVAIADCVDGCDLPEGFSVDLRGPFAPICAVPGDFSMALRHLIVNAARHHDRPSGRITIAGRRAGPATVIEIADDGPGIDGQFAERIFAPFVTLRPRDEVEGSGLGLAMVARAMERLGGCARLAPREGDVRGAVFELHFPQAN
jgi:signal transduction histidine kinase